MKAVAYMRVSGASQLEANGGNGFERQLDAITAYAQSHDFELVATFREEGISGKAELTDRPAFQEMVTALLSNCCRTIIVERLDRLAREYRIQEHLIMYLASKGIDIISADTQENVTQSMMGDPMRRALVQIQGVLAELDKNMLVAKLRKARASVRARGEFAGGNVPYGHIPKRATAAEIERAQDERKVAGYIRQLRSEGYTLNAIREQLVIWGYKPRNGETWQLSTIRQIALGKG